MAIATTSVALSREPSAPAAHSSVVRIERRIRRRPGPLVTPIRLIAAAAIVAVMASVASADPVRCRREILKRSAQLVQKETKALQACEDKVVTGSIPGPCPDAKTAMKIAKAEAKLRTLVARRCGGADGTCGNGDDDALATIGWSGGTCPGFETGSCTAPVQDCDDVATCLACVDHAATNQAIDLYYDSLTANPSSTVEKCQREIGRNAAKYLAAKSKALQKCADAVLKGSIVGPCPDGKAAAKIAAEGAKMRSKICSACGGADRACGGGDDLTPATLGFPSSCPDVTVPGGPSCAGAVGTLTALVNCVACVTDFKGDCTGALAGGGASSYPAECAGGGAAATPTPTGGATATRTSTPHVPTPTPTATPATCGNNTVDPGEDCDGTDDAGCDGQCNPSCHCPAPCTLPNPLPEVLSLVTKSGIDLDTGWTGIAHDGQGVDDGPVLAMRLEGCDTDTESATCGQCDVTGPIAFPGPAKNCLCYNLGDPDGSSLTACDPEAPAACGGSESCHCFYGAPLPLSSGAVPVCVVNRYVGTVVGTANVADTGPHAGEGSAAVRINASVHTGLAVERPCPTCEGDPTPRDGVKGGTCDGGVRDGLPCDVSGSNDFFGTLSLDCQPTRGANVGNLDIRFDPATTGTTSLTATLPCTAFGFSGFQCHCDTCATADAEPCNSDADCPGGATCGGLRCIGGSANGQACADDNGCPDGSCARPGEATRHNACSNGVCVANPSDGLDARCQNGPSDNLCSIETFRGCTNAADCNPPSAGGTCTGCQAGQTCGLKRRECFQSTIVRQGVPGTQSATLAATFCIPPTASSSVNAVGGLPGPGALMQPTRIFKSGAQCGNGMLDGGEACDGTSDANCPGACKPDCTCPTCGDGTVGPGEECDGGDDAACPGACQPNCSCTAGSCGNGMTEFGEECDGGDDTACPGVCQGDCTCGAFCGDATIDAGEECDPPASGGQCPAEFCDGSCQCLPFCGNGQVDPGEQCDGTGVGSCTGSCRSDCTCASVCGDGTKGPDELCDGNDDDLCPGQCTPVCTCPGQGEVTFVVRDDADLDTGWTGVSHDFAVQRGSTITGELSNCDGSDVECSFFANVGSFCSADPSRACTADNQCSGAGTCVINTFGPPLPLSAGGVPACIVNRFATDVTGTFNRATGSSELFVTLNSLVHLGTSVRQPCPICDCGAADPHDCQIGQAGTCPDIVGSPPCTVEGVGPFGPTSNDCPPSSSLNVSGGGLIIPFEPLSTGLVSVPASIPCAGGSGTCWCDGQPQASACNAACDGGDRNNLGCTSDAQCPNAPPGSCKPLCRQIVGETLGEGTCVAGPIDKTCAAAPEVGCVQNSDCPSGTGPCVTNNRRCFLDPIQRQGTPGTVTETGAAVFCIPATSGQAINQTAGLPGPGALLLPTDVTIRRCGDNDVNRAREECDGTDNSNCPGACLANCTCNATCGNNVVEFGEQCDGTSDTACAGQCIASGQPNECTCPPVCGDGFIGGTEQCDPGGGGGNPPPSDAACPGLCLAGSCQCLLPGLPTCGNNVLDAGEVCDLPAIGCGPLQACLACTQCFPPPDVIPPETGFICGNGNIEPTEVCELPAIGCGSGQICGPQCTECIDIPVNPLCGNLNIEAGEVCELPSIGCPPGNTCLLCGQCVPTAPVCGNLNIEPGEACELPARGCSPLQVCLLCQDCVP